MHQQLEEFKINNKHIALPKSSSVLSVNVDNIKTKLMREEEDSAEFNKIINDNHELLRENFYADSLNTNAHLMSSVPTKYSTYADSLSQKIKNDLNLSQPHEILLVHNLVSAHIRILMFTERLSSVAEINEISKLINENMKILGKELDRANHQFNQALTALRNLQIPNIQVKVDHLEAYIGNPH